MMNLIMQHPEVIPPGMFAVSDHSIDRTSFECHMCGCRSSLGRELVCSSDRNSYHRINICYRCCPPWGLGVNVVGMSYLPPFRTLSVKMVSLLRKLAGRPFFEGLIPLADNAWMGSSQCSICRAGIPAGKESRMLLLADTANQVFVKRHICWTCYEAPYADKDDVVRRPRSKDLLMGRIRDLESQLGELTRRVEHLEKEKSIW